MNNGDRGSQQHIDKIKQFQNILFNHYTDTKKILLSTERFADFSNHEIFYNLLGVLDELFLMMEEPDGKIVNKRLKRIEANLLIAQIYAIIASIPEIGRKLLPLCPWSRNNIKKCIFETKKILLEYKLAKLDKETDILHLDNLKNIYKAANRIEILKKVSFKAKNQFESLINEILPKWKISAQIWKGPIKLIKKNVDDEYLIKFQGFILDEYELSRIVLFDLLRRKGYHYHPAISDIRDAVDHIAKSLIYEPNDSVTELIHAAEHIRRAAVESIHSYVEDKFEKINKNFIEKQNLPKEIILDWCRAKEQLCYARYNKADTTWYYSVVYFYDSLDYLDKVEKQLDKLKVKDKHANP